MHKLDLQTAVRLEFIKYLYNIGVEQAAHPRPMNSACLMAFHDSVENYLHLACRMHGVKAKSEKPSFGDYFAALEQKLAQEIQWKDGLRALSKHRKELKHDGI